MRVDKQLFPAFKELCRSEGYGTGQAVEEFIRVSVVAKSVRVALDGAAMQTKAQKETDAASLDKLLVDLDSMVEVARVELAKSDVFHPQVHREESLQTVMESVQRVLPRIEDGPTRGRAWSAIDKAMQYVHAERLRNAELVL